VTPREIRALIEQFFASAGWPWSARLSRLIDELLAREEAA
jgi:hypothetical protein